MTVIVFSHQIGRQHRKSCLVKDPVHQDKFEYHLSRLFKNADDRAHYRTLIMQLWSRVHQFLSPQHEVKQRPYPAIIGISGAQGTGKTTLANLLVKYAQLQGVAAGSISLDDYYLSQSKRTELAVQIHPLLLMRGMPGTHHIEQAISDAKAVLKGQPICLPHFDKALDQPSAPRALQSFDLLIVEGWFLGLTSQTLEQLRPCVNDLELAEDQNLRWRQFVNQQLALNYQEYWKLCQPMIFLQAPDWASICRWRAKQEQQLFQLRGKGMTAAQLERFMQSFQRLTEHSFRVMPTSSDIVIELDHQQRPTIVR